MTGLAWSSVRARQAAFAASGLSILLGTTMVLAFLTLLESGLADGVSAVDRETLVVMASVVGSWALVIVVFSVASMLGLTVRRRAEEFALLRTIGGTRRQIRGLVVGEALGLALGAGALGIVPGVLLGRAVLGLVREGGLVADDVAHRTGPLSIASALGAVLAAAVLSGVLAARSATGGTAQAGLTGSRTGPERMSRKRIIGGSVLLLTGATCSALTVTVMAGSADPYAAMSTAGPASVFWSIGLAVLAPAVLRAVAALAGPLLRSSAHRAALHLALVHVRRRSHDLAGVLMPVLVFVGISTGTLYLMQIENRTAAASGVIGANLALVNYLVVGMIAVFAAIMAVNGTVAAVADRRREYALQRLAGLTRAELTTVAAVEASVVVAAAVVFGGLAALGTVVPYSVVRTDGWLSVSGPGWFLGVCAVAALVAVGTAVGATRRATAGPALRPQPV